MIDRFVRMAAAAALAAHAVASMAVPITIDPQAFAGTYAIVGVAPGAGAGIRSFDLEPGTYQVDIGPAGSCSRKTFVVTPQGSVADASTTSSAGAFEFDGSTLRFRNASVNVAPGGYPGRVWLQTSATADSTTPPFTRVVVPDTVYRLRVDQSFSSTHFHVDAAGNVQDAVGSCVLANPNFVASSVALQLSGNTLAPNTATVRIDPRQYPGAYLVIPTAVPALVTGVTEYNLIRGFTHIIKLSSLDSLGQVIFRTQADGTLAHFVPPAPAQSAANQVDFDNTASPARLLFRNVTVHFNPLDYAGSYRFDLTTGAPAPDQFGATTHVLVPDTRYEMRIGLSRIAYGVSADGSLHSVVAGALEPAAELMDFAGASATFRTARIAVTPTVQGDSGRWRIDGAVAQAGLSGPSIVSLVQNAAFNFVDLDAASAVRNATIDVIAPCAVDPEFLSYAGNSSYRLACAPVARAGADQVVAEGSLVTLHGAGSSVAAGSVPRYAWMQVAGPAVALNDPSAAEPTFVAPLLAGGSTVLTFQLVVGDGYASSAPDLVNVTVTDTNRPPVADAGDDFPLREGALGQLVGTHSYDPDGDSLTYRWVQIAGAPVTLQPSDTAPNPTFTAPLADGTPLRFRLVVSDGQLQSAPSGSDEPSAPDVVMVTIGANNPPSASAGQDQTVNEDALVVLDGSGSRDTDMDSLAYQWTQLSGPPVQILDAQAARASFVAPSVGDGGATLEFALVVTDDFAFNPGSSAPALVKVHVRNVADPPRCDLAMPSVAALWPPNHRMVEVAIANVVDPNGSGLAIAIQGVTQDEPVSGLGDGDTAPDAATGNGKVLLRAERAGGGNGRVYRVEFKATSSGQSCTGSVFVAVPHSRNSQAVDDGQLYSSN